MVGTLATIPRTALVPSRYRSAGIDAGNPTDVRSSLGAVVLSGGFERGHAPVPHLVEEDGEGWFVHNLGRLRQATVGSCTAYRDASVMQISLVIKFVWPAVDALLPAACRNRSEAP